MSLPERLAPLSPAPLLRLGRLSTLLPDDRATLLAAIAHSREVRSRREIISEGAPIREMRLVVSGWATRMRLLPDGRRQFLSLLLPGDLIGLCGHAEPLAISTVMALTDLSFCTAPDAEQRLGLAAAYEMSRAFDEAYLLAQITRLGRFNAQERIADLLLELLERLTLAGLAQDHAFDLPLTQETLADAVGLTPVHVNRVLQQMRRDGDIRWKQRRVTIADPVALALKVGRTPTRVSMQR